MDQTTKITIPANVLTPGLSKAVKGVVDGPMFSNSFLPADGLVTIEVPSYWWGDFLEWLAILISVSVKAPEPQYDGNTYDPELPIAEPPPVMVSLGGQIRGEKYVSLQMRNPNRPPEEQWVIFAIDEDWNLSFHDFAANYVADDAA